MSMETLEDVYAHQLGDLRSAEQQLIEALPKVSKAASADELREAIDTHLEETREHLERIEKLIDGFDGDVPDEKCKGMEGLLKEGDEVIEEDGTEAAKDAALIAAAQRVEHYEIAAYGTARTLAEQLGESEASELLQKTLDEESDADEKLTAVAQSVNTAAQ
jgi:ferritin-like metal-binding protein YciE